MRRKIFPRIEGDAYRAIACGSKKVLDWDAGWCGISAFSDDDNYKALGFVCQAFKEPPEVS